MMPTGADTKPMFVPISTGEVSIFTDLAEYPSPILLKEGVTSNLEVGLIVVICLLSAVIASAGVSSVPSSASRSEKSKDLFNELFGDA